MEEIIKLEPQNFKKSGNIWDMEKNAQIAERFYSELISGNRVTYVYAYGDDYIAEISLVFDMQDEDYTIEGTRLYASRLIVKPEYRRQGIGRKLISFAAQKAAAMGYSELSIGVDLDNYPALKLYADSGFDKIIYIGEDKEGKYVKLVKKGLHFVDSYTFEVNDNGV